MTIDSNRRFKHNGVTYCIITEGKKDYVISKVKEDGRFVLLYNIIGWDVPHFSTIKEAKRYVRDWDFILGEF